MKKLIHEQYGIKVSDSFQLNGYEAYRTLNGFLLIVPVSQIQSEELYELNDMSQYMGEKGDPFVATIIPTKQGNLFFEKEKVKYCVLRCPQYVRHNAFHLGRELAKFHQQARLFPYQLTNTNRIGQWKHLWEKRVDQLESFWQSKVHTHPLNTFEKMFVESFPYYLGLSENAIQYLVDTELDDGPQPIDAGTICHHRFHSNIWRQDAFVKLPTDWLFDHASRDIAEYLRSEYFHNETALRQSGSLFLEEYDRTTPLSSFSWRLLYSRLLFPLHYFECIEDYYLSSETDRPYYEMKLESIISKSSHYEAFLKSLGSFFQIRSRKVNFPILHWL